MKFALKFSMPKWERPKQEAPYISNPLINELEKVDFASLTTERRQDVLRRLKLACAAIAEDRRHQPAILSDRIRLQKMWQDYFKIAQTTPAGDNLGESLSISRYSEQEEEKPRALGAVMTMQEELVAAANFKIDLGGLDVNDMDDMDDFSLSSIPRGAPAPPPPVLSPAPHVAAAQLAASRNAATRQGATEASKAGAATAADEEMAEQMAKIKAVAPMALPQMAFPSDPVQEQVAVSVGPDAAFSIEVIDSEAEAEPQDTAQTLSPEDELAEQMARIRAVAPMALPPMAFPSEPGPEQVAPAPETETAFTNGISNEPETADSTEAVHDHVGELAEQMARIKTVAPMALPPMPHPADRAVEPADTTPELSIDAPMSGDHHETPQILGEHTLHIHDSHLQDGHPEETAPVAARIDAEAVEAETITVIKATGQADDTGFRPLTIAVVEAEPAPLDAGEEEVIDVEIVEAETVETEIVESEIIGQEIVAHEIVTAVAEESPLAAEMNVVEQVAAEPEGSEPVQPADMASVAVIVPVEPDKPTEAKPKRSRKASALATLRSMLSSTQAEKPAQDDAPATAIDPDTAPTQTNGTVAVPQQETAIEAPVEAPLPPKEREVSATPSTKEWVNIKLLRPSVIRGLPLPDQVITIVPYTEAKRLEENGSAIILTKPRTPRSSS